MPHAHAENRLLRKWLSERVLCLHRAYQLAGLKGPVELKCDGTSAMMSKHQQVQWLKL